MSAELDRGRRLSRRRMARVSFGVLCLELIVGFGLLAFHPDRAAIASALGASASYLGPLNAALVLIVLGYLGFSAMENTFKRE